MALFAAAAAVLPMLGVILGTRLRRRSEAPHELKLARWEAAMTARGEAVR